MNRPKQIRITIIITAKSQEEAKPAVDSLKQLLYPCENIELIIAIGHNPSLQRNKAAEAANGDYLLFLDNDSIVDPRLIRYYADAIKYEEDIGVVGGPSIYESKKDDFCSAVQLVYASVFGLGPFRSRYISIGPVRRTTEQELILCNLLISRSIFLAEKGFNPNIYPNEENEFLNRIASKTKIYYHPLAICYRKPRATFKEFAIQMFRYGEGRAKSIALFPHVWNQIFLVPMVLSIYALLIPFALLSIQGHQLSLFLKPIALYLALTLAAATLDFFSFRNWKLFFTLPILYPTCHFSYGIGLISGFIKTFAFKQEMIIRPVRIFKKKEFNTSW